MRKGIGMRMNAKKLTVQYAVLQGCYWVAGCAVSSFATVFLLHVGLKSSQVGIVMALSNILGVILQPVFASAADRAKRVTLHQITGGLAVAIMALLIFMQFIPGFILGVAVTFLVTNALLQVMQPLVSAISMYYVNRAVPVDFGIGRGIGSASFAVASTVLGVYVDKYYGVAIAVASCLAMAVMILTLFAMPVWKENVAGTEKTKKVPVKEKRQGGILAFVCRYRNFMVVMLGLTLIYVEHTFANTYLIQVVNNLGGNTRQLGTLMTVSAMSELPTMFLFSRVIRKWNSRTLICFSSVIFTVKAIGYLVCGSMSLLYLVQMMQMLAYALCLPAAVYYVNDTMTKEDKVKGQSLVVACNTLGGVFGSLLGGILLDAAGVKAMLGSGAAISAIGTVLVCVFVFRKEK